MHRVSDCLFYGLGLEDAGGSDGYADGSVLLKDPIEEVIVVSCNSGSAKNELAAGPHAKNAVFKVSPRWAVGGVLEKAGQAAN